MKYPTYAALSAVLLLGLAPAARAAESATTKKAIQIQLFNDADTNHDGKVTAQEFSDLALTMVFNAYDKDHSGKLSKAEYMAYVKKQPEGATAAREWKLMDPTNRGYITVDDLKKDPLAVARMKKRFRQLDKKNKGYITMADLPALKD